MSNELLPCPFCGADINAIEHGPECYFMHEISDWPKEKTYAAWNRRTPPTKEGQGQAGDGELPTIPKNSQDWENLDGATAWHLIERHADNWADIGMMMEEWRQAKIGCTHPSPVPAEPSVVLMPDGYLWRLLFPDGPWFFETPDKKEIMDYRRDYKYQGERLFEVIPVYFDAIAKYTQTQKESKNG